jgi:hypothetical protein
MSVGDAVFIRTATRCASRHTAFRNRGCGGRITNVYLNGTHGRVEAIHGDALVPRAFSAVTYKIVPKRHVRIAKLLVKHYASGYSIGWRGMRRGEAGDTMWLQPRVCGKFMVKMSMCSCHRFGR